MAGRFHELANEADRDGDLVSGHSGHVVEKAAVVRASCRACRGTGSLCDLDPNAIDNRSQNSFTVSEFAVLDNGEPVIMHDERDSSSTADQRPP